MLADILAQLQQKQVVEGKSGVVAAFELNWEYLKPETQQLACLLSLFALAPIPWSLVESAAVASNLEFDIKANCNVLIQRYILQKPAEDTYQIHERIRELLHLMLEQLPQNDELKHGFCQVMVSVAQDILRSAAQIEIPKVSLAIPHIAEAATVYQDWLNCKDLVWPFFGLGRFYESQAAYEQASAWQEQCLSFAKKRLGEDRLAVAQSYSNLANLYLSQGRYIEAKPLSEKVWELRQGLVTVNQGTEGQDLSGVNLIEADVKGARLNSDQLIRGITGNKPSRKQKFLTIYGYNNEDERTDNSTVIVLPTFYMEKVKVTPQSTTLKQKAAENLSQSVTNVTIENDFKAYLSIVSSFQTNGLPQPIYNEDEKKINFDYKEKTTYILIGLSNSQIDNISDQDILEKYFYIDTITNNNFHSFRIHCGRFDDSNKLLSPFKKFEETDMSTYGLFAKFKVGNQKIIVCGGTTGKSTNKVALYVSENWEHIYDELESEKRGTLDSNDSFALAIRVPRDEQSEDFAIEQKCIMRIA